MSLKKEPEYYVMKRNLIAIIPTIALALLLFLFSFHRLRADPPALSIIMSSSNQVSLTVTNGFNTNIYEIYFSEFLSTNSMFDANSGWTFWASGTPGQTNFIATTDETETGFFRALNGNDWDNDGVINSQDARPNDPTIGILTVTIESPTNNSTVY
jgi:hypothetical protein